MSTKIMFKFVIPFTLAITLAIGFSLIVSTSTQATPNVVNVASGENFRGIGWGGDHINEDVKIVDVTVDETTDNINGQSITLNSALNLSKDEGSPLVAVKTVNVDAAHPSEVIAYTITVTNTSPVAVENVSLTDYLADGLTELSSLTCNYGEATFSQRTVRWSGTVLTETPVVISYLVEIAKGAEGEILNDATVTYPDGEFDTEPVIVEVIPNIYYEFLPMVAH